MAKSNTLLFVVAAIVVGIIIVNSQNAQAGTTTDPAAVASEVSNQQFGLIQANEGFRGMPYADGTNGTQQLYSIGYGHQIQPGESSLLNIASPGISQQTATNLLMADIQNIVDAVNNTGVQFTQGQLDATTDLGMSGVQASLDLINIFNNQGAQAVADWLPTAYIHWHPVKGGPAVVNTDLVARRLQELNTWNAGSGL
jgi:GH24 family phage-related lysozyme (muramidase)